MYFWITMNLKGIAEPEAFLDILKDQLRYFRLNHQIGILIVLLQIPLIVTYRLYLAQRSPVLAHTGQVMGILYVMFKSFSHFSQVFILPWIAGEYLKQSQVPFSSPSTQPFQIWFSGFKGSVPYAMDYLGILCLAIMLGLFGLLFRTRGKEFERVVSLLFFITAGVYTFSYVGSMLGIKYAEMALLGGAVFFAATNALIYYLFTNIKHLH